MTRERVPLDWARTKEILGNALTTLGEKESGTESIRSGGCLPKRRREEKVRKGIIGKGSKVEFSTQKSHVKRGRSEPSRYASS
jgi:hypothetical protein